MTDGAHSLITSINFSELLSFQTQISYKTHLFYALLFDT
jgi:hypothetical protein